MRRRVPFWLALTLVLGIGMGLAIYWSVLTHWLPVDGSAVPNSDERTSLTVAPGISAPKHTWTFEARERGAILASPLVAGDRLYVPVIRDIGKGTSGGALYCLDRHTGKRIWRFDDGGHMQQTFSSPCLANGKLYLGEGMHEDFHCKLYCLDAATGRKCWDFPTAGHVESSPCVAENCVFFGAGDDGVYCLDAVTGRRRWRFGGDIHVDTSPAVIGQRLYAGAGTSVAHRKTEVFALDIGDGQVLWRTPTDLPVWGAPTVDGGKVFVGLGNGRLLVHPEHPAGEVLCLDAATGKQLWRWHGTEAVFDQPAVDRDHVYFGARNGVCYCVERTNGQVRWQTDLGSPIIAAPRLGDHRVYAVASAGRLCRLDAVNGRLDWSMNLAVDAHSQPRAISMPAVVSAADNGHDSIYLGFELVAPTGSTALLYAVRD
ncbi:MAG TPA: PQQ-binding-like beta-propeller repeat protein [Gemmataceae bacterium]|nr:PQQ-binding-like beta-propeller repeat protein [Gemmataceae bacterium]